MYTTGGLAPYALSVNGQELSSEDGIFAVENLSTGEVRPFKFGEAFIRAKSSDWLKIVLNTDFTHVFFDGEKVRAGKLVKIVQSCSSETTLDSIFDSFNDTFSSK